MNKLRRSLLGEEHKEASIRVRAALERRREYLDARQGTGDRCPITDLYTEDHLEERLHEEVLRARRYGHELGFSLVEIERFGKFVADRTEQAGNQAIKTVADLLVSNLRKVDVVMRYGEIGFGIVLPHTAEVSERVLQRLLRRVQKERIGANTPRARGLTLRAGVAVFPLDGLTAEDIFQAARDALTRAGEEGGTVERAAPLRLEEEVLESGPESG
jgi:diguanylate cyclase (GGDEF)-like protein